MAEAEAKATLAWQEGSHPLATSHLSGRAPSSGQTCSPSEGPSGCPQTQGMVRHGEQDESLAKKCLRR